MSRSTNDSTVEGEKVNHTASLDGFPELWTEILKRVPHDDMCQHVHRVSRRFAEASRDPNLWPALRVSRYACATEERWQSFLHWLVHRAAGLRTLAVLAELGTGVVRRPRPAVWHSAELFALLGASAPQLRSLEYQFSRNVKGQPVSGLPEQLGQLSQLTCLRLSGATITSEQVDACVSSLSSLQTLAIDSPILLCFPIGIINSCSQLRHLVLSSAQLGAVQLELGRLTALTHLSLAASNVKSLPDSISLLTGLRELVLWDNSHLSLPSELTQCQQLTQLDVGHTPMSPVLARLHSLRSLVAGPAAHYDGEPPSEAYWTQLTALTELDLYCNGRFGGEALPAGLAGMARLQKLMIIRAQIADLPAGAYISCLQSLCMEGCTFTKGLPAGLAVCTQLRHLELRIKDGLGHIYLTSADRAIIGAITALETLLMYKPATMSHYLWNERVAQLAAEFAAAGREPPKVRFTDNSGNRWWFRDHAI